MFITFLFFCQFLVQPLSGRVTSRVICLRRKNDWDTHRTWMTSSSYHCDKQSTTRWRSDAVPSTLTISMHVADELNFVDVGTTGRRRSRHCVTTTDDHLYEMSVVTQIQFRRDQLRRRPRLVANGSSTGGVGSPSRQTISEATSLASRYRGCRTICDWWTTTTTWQLGRKTSRRAVRRWGPMRTVMMLLTVSCR